MSAGSAVPECFAVKDLITHQYDIYTLLFYLHNKSNHPGVRDFLTHKLYTQRDEDIDAILPQLCHLFMIWSPDSSVLADFFVHLCANSIHFALKINWTLRAQIYHLPSGGRHLVQKECMEKLLASCEMSLINASIIGPDGKMRKKERKPRTAATPANDSSTSTANRHQHHHHHHHHHSHSHSHSSHTHPSLPRALSGDVDAEGRRRSVITSTTFRSSRDPSPVNSIQQSPRRLGDITNINLTTVPATPPHSAFENELSPPAPVYRPPSDSPPPPAAPAAEQPFLNDGSVPAPSASPPLSQHPISELRVSSPSVSDNEIDQQLLDVSGLTLDPNNATTPASTTSSASTPSSAASAPLSSSMTLSSFSQLYCPSHAISIDDLVNAASSSVRAEYFKQLQKLMQEFGRISAMLVKIPHHQGGPVNLRNQKLRKFMAELAPLARNMYFPTYDPSHRHYRLLRILPEETFILNSRDKAPFLFHFEVQYTTSTLHPPAPMSVYDSDLYFAYKSKDDIVAETFGSRLKCEACENIRKQHQTPTSTSNTLTVDGTGSEITRPASSNPELLSVTSAVSSSRALDIPAQHRASDASSGRLVQSTSLPQEMNSLLLNKPASSDSPRSSVLLQQFGQPILPPPSSRTPAPMPTANVVAAPRSSPSSQASSPLLRHVSLASPFETLSVQAFGESFTSRKKRVQAQSHYFATMKDTDVLSLIFKHGDDVRQEVMTMQLIRYLQNVFQHASLPLMLTPYSVDITSGQSGLIETVKDAISIDSLKKNVSAIPIHSHLSTPIAAASGGSNATSGAGAPTSLAAFFHYYFSLLGPELHERAVKNFAESMAAYSVISYLFQIKDRHNGNILVKMDGSIVHIDFGFVLSNSPGSNWNFEAAPFKLTEEFVQVFGGEASEMFDYYKLLVIRGYLEARKHADTILLLLQVLSVESKMACWANSADATIAAVKERFHLDWTEEQCMEFAYGMIESSINNWRTVQYDRYQEIVNNIK